ncbi:MAG: histidine phosphatase family protein [Phycisphaeraceae bacterium]|nr:histidine phosphatase family protein [Phycisphaeraceae bacterium]
MRLLILRHGKAEKHSVSGRDTDRALTDRGLRQAAWIGQLLLSRSTPACDRIPERIHSSPARRAQQTASAVAEFLGLHVEGVRELDVDEPLSGLVDVFHTLLRQGVTCVLLVGHNPQLEALSNHLLACADSTARTSKGAAPHKQTPRTRELRTGELFAFEVEFDERVLQSGLDWPCTFVGDARLEGDPSTASASDEFANG